MNDHDRIKKASNVLYNYCCTLNGGKTQTDLKKLGLWVDLDQPDHGDWFYAKDTISGRFLKIYC